MDMDFIRIRSGEKDFLFQPSGKKGKQDQIHLRSHRPAETKTRKIRLGSCMLRGQILMKTGF